MIQRQHIKENLKRNSIITIIQSDVTKEFFMMVQNRFHYAITGQTAPEIIYTHANRHEGIRHIESGEPSHDEVRQIAIDKINHHLQPHAVNEIAHRTAKNHHHANAGEIITLVDAPVENE